MRDARFIGLSADGRSLIVEHAGEHLRLPVDEQVRAAVRDQVQMPMPLQTRVSPRELQHRIRCGESSAQIAAAAGVAVDLIARFEGPVLDERRWHAEQAQRTVVDGLPLAERFASATTPPGDDPDEADWDSWLGDDGCWRVSAQLPDGRRAVWAWDPRTRRLRARDDLARLSLSGDIAADDLEAVLRPIAAARHARRLAGPGGEPPAAAPEPDLAGHTIDLLAPGPRPGGSPLADTEDADDAGDASTDQPEPSADVERAARTEPLQRRRSNPAKRRAQVPAWDDIVFGSTRRPADD